MNKWQLCNEVESAIVSDDKKLEDFSGVELRNAWDREDAERAVSEYLGEYTMSALYALRKAIRNGAVIVTGGWLTTDIREKSKFDRFCVWASGTDEEIACMLSMSKYAQS